MDDNQLAQHRQLFGISNTYLKGQPPLAHTCKDMVPFLEDVESLLFIPYALDDMDAYADKLRDTFLDFGVKTFKSIHEQPGSELDLLAEADAVYIGGGNTLRLVANLQGLKNADGGRIDQRPDASQHPLIPTIRKRVAEGMKLLGASAGFNVMFADVRTTNDMHIAIQHGKDGAQFSRVDAIGVFPPHLSGNPHYLDKIQLTEAERALVPEALREKVFTLIDHQGESRQERLEQALEMDPDRIILALREGAYVIVNGMQMTVGGTTGGFIFRSGQTPQEIGDGDDLSGLLGH